MFDVGNRTIVLTPKDLYRNRNGNDISHFNISWNKCILADFIIFIDKNREVHTLKQRFDHREAEWGNIGIENYI